MNEDVFDVMMLYVIDAAFVVLAVYIDRRFTSPNTLRWSLAAVSVFVFILSISVALVTRGVVYAMAVALPLSLFASALLQVINMSLWLAFFRVNTMSADLRESIMLPPMTYNNLVDWMSLEIPSLRDVIHAFQVARPKIASSTNDVVEFVVAPYIVEQLNMQDNARTLKNVFDFFEIMANHYDVRIRDLLDERVCHALASQDRTLIARARQYMGPATSDICHRSEAR